MRTFVCLIRVCFFLLVVPLVEFIVKVQNHSLFIWLQIDSIVMRTFFFCYFSWFEREIWRCSMNFNWKCKWNSASLYARKRLSISMFEVVTKFEGLLETFCEVLISRNCRLQLSMSSLIHSDNWLSLVSLEFCQSTKLILSCYGN